MRLRLRDLGPVTAPRGIAVVAVGGNALTRADQRGAADEIAANAAEAAAALVPLVRSGRPVVVVHGNGPQVGNLALQQDALADAVPAQPLHQLSAMTQGQLGGVLVRAIDAECGAGVAVCVLTHVLVDPADPAFAAPSKPIGPFLSAGEAAALARDRGWSVVEDAGRGHRRVVPSPAPTGVVEIAAVRRLLQGEVADLRAVAVHDHDRAAAAHERDQSRGRLHGVGGDLLGGTALIGAGERVAAHGHHCGSARSGHRTEVPRTTTHRIGHGRSMMVNPRHRGAQ
jgi:hypothetical protein